METVVYGFQISPGFDDEFTFAATQEQCQEDCVQHRNDILTSSDQYGAHNPLGAMAVYRFVLKSLSINELLTVLNDEHHDLLKVAVVEKKLVAVVAE